MATAAQVLKASLQKILVQASEADFEPDEFSDAIDTMNQLMLAYDADGIKLGYTEVSTLGDPITIPTGALRGLIYNLAIDLVPEYGGVATPAVVKIASDGLDTMEKLGITLATTRLPPTLPIGSGNEDTNSFTSHYYPDQEADILAETTGSIALETGTEALL